MRQWVFSLPVGRPVLFWDPEEGEAGAYVEKVVDDEWATTVVANTNRALMTWATEAPPGGTPYTLPVLREHNHAGWRGGNVYGAKLAGEGAWYGIYLDTEWLPGVAEQIDRKETCFVSIGTYGSYLDYAGRDFGPMVEELSITENPRLKNMGSIQDTRALRLSDALAPRGAKKMTLEDIAAMIEAQGKRLDAIEARQVELEKKDDSEVEIEAADKNKAADPADTTEEEPADPAMQLADKLVARSIQLAEKKLAGLKLGEGGIPVQQPAKKLSRREVGIKKGLTGKALADFTLGITE